LISKLINFKISKNDQIFVFISGFCQTRMHRIGLNLKTIFPPSLTK
jgi:hypothetical protein